MPRRVTLRDLAKSTGVHFSTVGLALRKDPRVSKSTSDRVWAAAMKSGYRQDPMLSALSSYRHQQNGAFRGTVALLAAEPFHGTTTPTHWFIQLIWKSAKECAAQMGFKVDYINVAEERMTPGRVAQVLESRGINGLLLAPLPSACSYIDLPWEKFCTVAIGYSITSPLFHRACFHQARSMWLHLKELRALGYRRIGLVLSRDSDLRTDHNLLGAYLAEQHQKPDHVIIPPHITTVFDKQAFGEWLARETPDCVMGASGQVMTFMQELGYAVPRDIGFSSYCWTEREPELTGIDERWSALSTTALELLVELMKNGEYGTPVFPRFSLVPGQWRPGRTVRAVETPLAVVG